MAQKWATISILTATTSIFLSYEKQNEIAKFLWPQIPSTAIPYPGGILFRDYKTTKPPPNNHSPWGLFAFPIAGIGSYYVLKYKTKLYKPQYLSLYNTFCLKSPRIVQHCIPLTIAIPFATFAKIYRDGPGEKHDREFYRGDESTDNAWDFFDYHHPEPERPLMDRPDDILNIIHRYDMNPKLNPDYYPTTSENPFTESLLDQDIVAWNNAQLGIEPQKPRDINEQWLKLRRDQDNPFAEWLDSNFVPIPNADPSLPGITLPNPRLDNGKFAVDPATPAGRLQTFGSKSVHGMRLPWSTNIVASTNSSLEPNVFVLGQEHGHTTYKDYGEYLDEMNKSHDMKYKPILTEAEFFNSKNGIELNEQLRHQNNIQHGLDIHGQPIEIATKFTNMMKGNATALLSAEQLDSFALEKRKSKEYNTLTNNSWQSYYYHPHSVVGRDEIPLTSRITAKPQRLDANPWKLQEEYEEDWINTYDKRHETYIRYQQTRKKPPIPVPASDRPVFDPTKAVSNYMPSELHYNAISDTPLTIDEIRVQPDRGFNLLRRAASPSLTKPLPLHNIPGYARNRSYAELRYMFWALEQRKHFETPDVNHYLPREWFPHEVKDVVKNRHQYYTGRGIRYADEPNYYTKQPSYDPNVIPAHPRSNRMSIQEAEDYYTEVQRDDHEYAKQVSGSFNKLYNVPFPKFQEPTLYDENTIKRFPHLSQVNKRLEMQTRYFNSLEDRVLNQPTEAGTWDKTNSNSIAKLKQSEDQIKRNEFNPDLYRTSNQYRNVWQEMYPALKMVPHSATADQLEYIMSFASESKEQIRERNKYNAPALQPSHTSDRFVHDAVEHTAHKARKDPSSLFDRYHTDVARQKREFTPRDLLQREIDYKNDSVRNQPLSQEQLYNEQKRDQHITTYRSSPEYQLAYNNQKL